MGFKLRVYLDTSILNFMFADDAPEKMEITKEFKERRIVVVNQMNGYYYPLRLATPLEVMNDEDKS